MNERYGDKDVISVAISFSRGSHKDEVEEVIEIIKGFEDGRKKKYSAIIYMDRDNIGGDSFDNKIKSRFSEADIIICLVTNKFLDNDYVLVNERPIIKKFASPTNNKRVIPIIVSRTNNYINSWMGSIRTTTLPNLDALKKPYSHYNNKEDAKNKVQNELHRVFLDFQKKEVAKRIKTKQPQILNYIFLKKIFLLISVFLIVLSVTFYWSKNQEKSDVQKTQNKTFEIEDLEVKESKNYGLDSPTGNSGSDAFKAGSGKQTIEYSIENSPYIQICNSKTGLESNFPRELSSYPYFGQETYGIYESCQGLNVDGYKPCKKDNKWYIVNEKKLQHLLIDMDIDIHHKIYAIRPLLNNVAEVYYYNQNGMFLSSCISLENGKFLD